MEYVTVITEWDIGLNDRRYADEDIARAHVAKAMAACGVDDISVEEAEDEGLVSFEYHDTDDIITTMPEDGEEEEEEEEE